MADYICSFRLPEAFLKEDVCISLQGVESGFALWLNGLYIGYSEDSFTPADFRLTEALCEGENRLAIRVWKWTPGSWFEDQDFFRFSGIFRSVYLYTVPKTAVTDLSVLPQLDDDFENGLLRVTAYTCGSGSLRLRLFERNKELQVSESAIDETLNHCSVTLQLSHPLLWSAEAPNLYQLVLEVCDREGRLTETIEQKVGFRRIEIKDGIPEN